MELFHQTKWVNQRLNNLAKRVSVDLNQENAEAFLKESWGAIEKGGIHPLDVERILRLTRNILLAHKNGRIKISKNTLEYVDRIYRRINKK